MTFSVMQTFLHSLCKGTYSKRIPLTEGRKPGKFSEPRHAKSYRHCKLQKGPTMSRSESHFVLFSPTIRSCVPLQPFFEFHFEHEGMVCSGCSMRPGTSHKAVRAISQGQSNSSVHKILCGFYSWNEACFMSLGS